MAEKDGVEMAMSDGERLARPAPPPAPPSPRVGFVVPAYKSLRLSNRGFVDVRVVPPSDAAKKAEHGPTIAVHSDAMDAASKAIAALGTERDELLAALKSTATMLSVLLENHPGRVGTTVGQMVMALEEARELIARIEKP